MRYIADLHIHSPYSRATSPTSDLPGLAAWAQVKGIHVIGTGDFTHPAWFSQVSEQLVPAEPGFFRLKNDAIPPALDGVAPENIPVRFLLSTEISSIYKRHGQVRKVHNIVYVPDLASAARLNARLAAIGNIESDGRPILGLDSRDLLDILLEVAPEGFLVPAHIWTPWFSLFGSKSGFDSVEECFGDLSDHVFALETGLSSDPEMNRRVSALDRFSLISNSDCHSPNKLGREANIFDTGFDYFSLRNALKNPNGGGLAATIEFFPEEGKYHADGHRDCQVCLTPHETRDLDAICPACGKPLTVGVLHRVLELADRDKPRFPAGAPQVHSIIPLPEVLGELLGAGPTTKGAMALYAKTIARFGSEFTLLLTTPLDEIKSVSPLLAEAVGRIRSGNVIRKPGFDGEFGVIRVFEEGEQQRLAGQNDLFATKPPRKKKAHPAPDVSLLVKAKPQAPKSPVAMAPNPEQEAAITASGRRLLVSAGPGTGKTFTLVARLAHLLKGQAVPADHCAAITFTNRAANELRERLDRAVGPAAAGIFVGTFHRFCLDWLREQAPDLALVGIEERQRLLRRLFPELGTEERKELGRAISDHGEQLASGAAVTPSEMVARYLSEINQRNALDLDHIIPACVQRLHADSRFRQQVSERVRALLVDEFQDLNASQYALVEAIAETAQIFAIGDPNQAIYGFRGSDLGFFYRFADHPECRTLRLTRNYRSAAEILTAATAVIEQNHHRGETTLLPCVAAPGRLEWQEATTTAAEAEGIAQRIEQLVGGTSHYALRLAQGNDGATLRAFGDLAILCRLSQQTEAIHEALAQHGIPCQVVGATPFYMKKPLRPATILLRVAAGNADAAEHLALLTLQPGIGEATVDLLDQTLPPAYSDFFPAALALDLPPAAHAAIIAMQQQREQLRRVAQAQGVATAVTVACTLLAIDPNEPAVKRFQEFAALFGHDLPGFADHLQQNAQSTAYDQRADAVALMTMHTAKGLEFPVIFLAGLEEGLIPCTLGSRACDLEEERRLFYVALTRARELACLSMAACRTIHGQTHDQQPSRFVAEIPAALLTRITKPTQRPKPAVTQMKLF